MPDEVTNRHGWIAIVPVAAFIAMFAAWPPVAVNASARLNLPDDVRKHFESLPVVDFCTIDPYDAMDDHGFGKVGKWFVLDRRKDVPTNRVLSKLTPSDGGALCFIPRHAIQDPADRENCLLICFECQWVWWQTKGKWGKVPLGQNGRDALNSLAIELGMLLPSRG